MSDSEAAAVTAQDDLHAPSPEEAPIAQVEEEEVAYDEEPDEEQQTDGPAPVNSAEAHSEDLQQGATELAAAAEIQAVPKSENLESEEWELSNIPDEWKPAPLFKVKNIPSSDNIDEGSVRKVLEGADLQVRSVAFDTVKIVDKRVAYVRLQPPPIPSKITDKQETDVSKIAIAVVKRLKEADPPLQLGEDKLQFDTSHPQVQLFIGNITEEWSDDVSLRKKMEEYGPVERCLVVHNHKGQTKGYAFVEYSVPNGALKCKEGMDKIEAEMRPDFRRKEGLTIQANGRWQQIKLLRAEWAHPRTIPGLYSRVLYITNLTPGFSDISALRQLFEKFGPVNECHLPRNKQTGNSKGFAFVEFRQSIFADAAYRDVDESEQDFMGSKLVVSFANPAKHYDNHAIRPQNNGSGSALAGGANGKLGLRANIGAAGGLLTGRSGLGNKPGFNDRLSPTGSFANARGNFNAAGQLGAGSIGFNNDDMAVRLQQQTMQMQQQMQLQYQRQMQMTMQQQMRAQQALLQAQLRAAQAQVQQYQEQALQYKTQATQAQLKAQQEAEARKRIEAEAARAVAARMTEKPRGEYGSAGLEANYSGGQAAFAAAYGSQAGYPSAGTGTSGRDAYGGTNLYSQGFAAASQGWPSMGSSAQGTPNGTPSMYGASPGGQQAGYSTGQDLFGQSANYATPGAYGAFAQQQAGYGGSQAAYGSIPQGFGVMPGNSTGYSPAAFAQAGMSPYGQSTNNVQSGQKRDSGYDQANAYGSYSGHGTQGSQSGQDNKRQRY